MASQSLNNLLTQIKNVQPANELERQALYQAGCELVSRTQDSFEAVNRIVYAPQLLYVTKVGVDLGLFTTLSQCGQEALSIDELAQKSAVKPEPLLVKRILRFLASHYLVKQVDAKRYAANDLTRALANPSYQAGIVHSADCLMLCVEALPRFLADTSHKNPTDSAHCPFQLALKTDLPAWAWSLTQPALTAHFAKWMQAHARPGETWMDVVDVPAYLQNTTPETPIFVDIGGSIGHQAVAFKQRFPNIPGRVILQDLEGPIGAAIADSGIEKAVVDFWQPQEVKGARIYYMRNILHDFADDKAVELLKLTKAAAGPESVIVIDEVVLPDVGAHWRATAMDITMMSSLAALERTESEWCELLRRAGLFLKSAGHFQREMKTYQRDTAWSVLIAA